MIPKQLKDKKIRFCLLGKWDEFRNKKPLGKAPFEKSWQTNGYTFDDPKLLEHIKSGKNYGVIGGYGNLRMLDVDDPTLVEHFQKELGKTFAVKTGSGGMHFYFYSDYDTNRVLAGEKGELRVKNYQVVGAGSKHPGGKFYEVVEDVPIKTISVEEVERIVKPYLRGNEKPSTKTEGEDTSRSGLEYRKCIALLRKGKSREEVYKIMEAYSKWATATDKYKSLTFEKAEDFVLDRKQAGAIFKKSEQAKVFNERQPIFYDRAGMFWMWNEENKCWRCCDDVDVLNFIRDDYGLDVVSSKNRTEILNSLKQEGRKNIPKDFEPTWVQFGGLIYDFKKGKSFEATTEYFATNPIGWDVGESEDTPTIDRLFEEWVGKDYVKTLYELFAYCTTANKFMQRLFVWEGGGTNGKSTCSNLLQKFIGKSNSTTSELKALCERNFEMAILHKKLLCTLGEVGYDDLKQTGRLKCLSGEDQVRYEFKNKQPFPDKNSATIICLTNSLPATSDKTPGFYRRWLQIYFPNEFAMGKDPNESIPDVEFRNLAKKCLRRLSELYKTKKFTNEGTIKEREISYEKSANPVIFFIEQFCEDTPGEHIPKKKFYDAFNEWLKNNHQRPFPAGVVTRMLKNNGYDVGSRKVYGESTQVVVGLSFTITIDTIDTGEIPLSSLRKASNSKTRSILGNLGNPTENDWKINKKVQKV